MIIDMDSLQPLVNGGSKGDPHQQEHLESALRNDDGDSLQDIIQQDPSLVFNLPKTTAFHLAVEHSDKQQCSSLKTLLHSTLASDFINRPDIDAYTPLHCAAKNGKIEALKMLLGHKDIQVNARDDFGDTALHMLAKDVSNTNAPQMILCLDELLAHKDIDLEPRNNRNYTPLMIPIESMSSEGHGRIDNTVLTFCRRLVSKGASLDAKYSNNVSIEDMLEEKKAKSSILMCNRQQPPERPKLSVLMDTLILNGDISQSKFKKVLKQVANMWIGSSTALYYVVNKRNYESTKTLLAAGADPAYTNDKGEIVVLHRAIARGHTKILTLILDCLKRKSGKNKLDLTQHSFKLLNDLLVNDNKIKNSKSDINYLQCLKILLSSDIVLNVNQEQGNRSKKTALYVAASLNNQEAIELLLVAGARLGTDCVITGTNLGNVIPALRPTTLTSSMDKCIERNVSKDQPEEQSILDPKYSLLLDYTFLMPEEKQSAESPCEFQTIMDIKNNKQHRRSLSHPLIQVLLYIKWMKILPLYIINLSLYFIFVVFLTWFMYSLKDLRILETRKAANVSGYHLTPNSTIEEEIKHYGICVKISMAFVIPLTVYILIREIFQICFTKASYLKNIENLLEVFLIVVVVILSLFKLDAEWTRHLAAWAVIAAGYEFVLILGRVPSLAIYVTMLRNVAWNYLRMIFLYGSLIVVFAFSFNIILYPTLPSDEAGDFSTFWTTLPKSIVMATGEFEYSDLRDEFSVDVIFATSAVLLFLAFLFLIFLVLLNIMTGLAVTDTHQIMEDATLYSLTSRLELIYVVEMLFRLTPCIKRLLPRLLVFPGSNKQKLIVYFNDRKKSNRVTFVDQDKKSRLDNLTADNLRNHWTERVQEKSASDNDPMQTVLSKLEMLSNQIDQLTRNEVTSL